MWRSLKARQAIDAFSNMNHVTISIEEGWFYDERAVSYTDNYITSTLQSREDQLAYPFIVIDQQTGEVAGLTRLGHIVLHNRRLEIGWTWYGKAYRGTGLNKACKFELLKYVFENLGFRRVQFSVDVENIRFQKAVIKLGAKQEGVFRSN
jgi:RimJ/RimL family protein N-acetyltransferase